MYLDASNKFLNSKIKITHLKHTKQYHAHNIYTYIINFALIKNN